MGTFALSKITVCSPNYNSLWVYRTGTVNVCPAADLVGCLFLFGLNRGISGDEVNEVNAKLHQSIECPLITDH